MLRAAVRQLPPSKLDFPCSWLIRSSPVHISAPGVGPHCDCDRGLVFQNMDDQRERADAFLKDQSEEIQRLRPRIAAAGKLGRPVQRTELGVGVTGRRLHVRLRGATEPHCY